MRFTSIYLAFLGMALMITSSSLAQRRAKYKDILPGILASESASAVAALKSELSLDPLNPSIFLQLGLIYEKRFTESDPIKDYKKAMANIKLANEAFANSKLYLNEKEVKKNKEEYINFAVQDEKGKWSASLDSIYRTMEAATATMAAFEAHVPAIYNDFTNSYVHYDRANKRFTEILGRYSRLKDLYMLYDEDLHKEFEEIKKDYESGLSYFAAYKEKIKDYEIGYDQELKIEPIGDYKLDGLAVEINFLEHKVIQIWDYAKWVDDIESYLVDNITDLREMMTQNQKLNLLKLSKVEEQFSAHEDGEFETLKVNKELLFILRKYDLKSVVEPLFLYQERKHSVAFDHLMSEKIAMDTVMSPERKISNYGQMLITLNRSDQMLANVKQKNVVASYEKYPEWIDTFYEGISGINDFSDQELSQNQEKKDTYLKAIRSEASRKYLVESENGILKYNGISVPDFVAPLPPGMLITPDLVTTHRVENVDGSAYLGGVYLDEATQMIGSFVCRKDTQGRVVWLKKIFVKMNAEENDSHTKMALLFANQTGCSFVLNASHRATQAKMNVLYGYSDKGEELLTKSIEVEEFPRAIHVMEEENAIAIVFSGTDYYQDDALATALTLGSFNTEGEEIWKSGHQFAGNFTGLVVTSDGYMIGGNYRKIKDKEGVLIDAEHGMASFVTKFGKEGKWNKQLLLPFTQPYATNQFFSTGDHCINLFGSRDMDRVVIDSDGRTMTHIIINKDLEVVSSSLDE